MRQDLGVARVGRLAPEDDRAAVGGAEDLVEQRQLELAVAGTAEFGTEVARPQALLADDLLQRLDELVAGRVGHVPCVLDDAVDGRDLLVDELLHPVQLRLELGGVCFEIPCHVDRLLPLL